MSFFAFLGTLEIGLVYGLVALGVYLTFRILDFPDLSVDGSFPMGAAVAATAIIAGFNPWAATLLAIAAGGLCGLVTAFLAVRCGILHLLASILTMIAAFSINIRIMGSPNLSLLGEDTLFTPFEMLAFDSGLDEASSAYRSCWPWWSPVRGLSPDCSPVTLALAFGPPV